MSRLRRIHCEKIFTVPSDVINMVITPVPQIQFDVSRDHTIQIISAQLPSTIPNIYNDGLINTGLCAISNDGGVTWLNMQLSDGVYTLTSIANAINAAIPAGWYINPVEPALILQMNPTLNKCYIIIDSTKMVGGAQFAIDFAVGGSELAILLGFTPVSSFIADGTYTADAYPHISYQGTSINMFLAGFGKLSSFDALSAEYLCSINTDPSQGVISYCFPGVTNAIPFEIPCIVGPTVSEVKIDCYGRNNRPLHIMSGTVVLDFIIIEH